MPDTLTLAVPALGVSAKFEGTAKLKCVAARGDDRPPTR